MSDAVLMALKKGKDEAAYGTARHPLACAHEVVNGVSRSNGPLGIKERGACADCSALVERKWTGDGPATDEGAGWSDWQTRFATGGRDA